ncbi:MAG: DksA/TraR family C4-type zinc finger protein [Gammaproteobacteria bacterium]|nr:DksA/TraR family C4-type zinc finger protein [Gammaproteobacteria bacterium]
MATGWAKDGAVQDQIDASIADAVERARARLAQTQGESLTHCEDCEEEIPAGRRQAVPGVRRCVRCQESADADERFRDPVNRRGSKDSQLR